MLDFIKTVYEKLNEAGKRALYNCANDILRAQVPMSSEEKVMLKKALDKINSELKEFKGGQAEAVMKKRCAEILKEFCRQDTEFSQAVVQTDRTLSDCLKAIASKYTSKIRQDGISDLEAFKTMAQFYFPGAGVHFSMTVDVNANEPAETFEAPITMKQTASADDDDIEDETVEEQEAPAPKQEAAAPKLKKSLTVTFDDLLDV